jgi:hypothetical protein
VKNRGYHCFDTGYCTGTVIGYTHIMFLTMAGVVNIYNWLAFTLSLRSISRLTNVVLEKKKIALNLLTPFTAFVIFSWFVAVFIYR